jgi:Amiloride-sensitive sodium channel.
MKNTNDGSIVLSPDLPYAIVDDIETDALKSDEKQNKKSDCIKAISKKYGLPFSLNSRENGPTKPVANGNLASIFAKKTPPTETATDKPSGANGETLQERFRRAGMKARLARRMEKIAEDRMTIKQIFNRYVQNSTLHGFRFIFMDTFYARRFLWFVLTCSFAVIFFMELEKSIKLYYQYPFTTLSTIEYVPELNFPAISICNLNNYKASRIRKSKLSTLYERDQFPFHGEPFNPGFDIPGSEVIDTFEATSQTMKDIFKSCEWKSRDTAKTGKPNLCGTMNFTRYANLEGETCFTFNADTKNILSLNETGLNMAFKLELDLRVKDSVQSLQEVGVKIVIHDQNETPLHNAGFIVSPGFQTFVEMKVKKVRC